jgi:hypothetical protein
MQFILLLLCRVVRCENSVLYKPVRRWWGPRCGPHFGAVFAVERKNTPWHRVRFTLGLGTSGASLATKSSSSQMMCVWLHHYKAFCVDNGFFPKGSQPSTCCIGSLSPYKFR